MLEVIFMFITTLTSLLIGYNLGKHQRVIPEDIQKTIKQIYRRAVPDTSVGPVERPTARDNYIRDNPNIAREQEVMNDTLDILNK